ncbi:MAG TPA: phosphatase PAP2 family protein [Candidatus Pelethocola excrementipullorum]|nr:phosphatase PAP2 family protein [Candidatus Pelethocola excrementipullorum]
MDFLRFIAEFRTPAGDYFFQGITYLAQELLVVAFICWFFWCGNKRLAYQMGFSYFLSGLTIQGLKIALRIPRPWLLDPSFQPVESAIPGATGYSFPSGHTQSGTAFFTTLAFNTQKKKLRLLCVLGFLLIGFSRMYLGVHTPADVLTSMGISFMLTSLICHFWKYFESDTSHDLLVSMVFSMITILLLVYDIYLVKMGVLNIHNAMDCCKACGAGLAFSIGFYLERRYLNFAPPASPKGKMIRFLVGLAVTATLEFGLKAILPTHLFTAYLRYFLIVSWIIVIYPLIFTRFSSGKVRDRLSSC